MEETWEIVDRRFDPVLNAIETERHYEDLKMPHLFKILNYLKDNKIKIALASASPRITIENVLQSLKVEDYFSYYLSGEVVIESKPNPIIYIKTMDKIGVKPEETIVIEDSPAGIRAGIDADAKVIAIKDHRFDLKQDHANVIVDDLQGAYNIIKKHIKNK